MQWLAGLSAFLAIYIPILTGIIRIEALDNYQREIKLFPFLLVGMFGVCCEIG